MAPSLTSAPLLAKKTRSAKDRSHQRLGQLHHGGGVVDVGDVHQLRQLGRGGLGDLRVGVAQVAHRQPGQAVQVLPAVIVPDPAALRP